MDFSVAVCIPTYNAGNIWETVLQSINNQQNIVFEKIIVDSGSTDETVSLARQHGFKVIEIDKSTFNHGATRQLLVDLSTKADVCVFLTQDAILADIDSILNIVKAFDDPKVGMAYGRQLPHKNAAPLETHARLYNYNDKSEVLSIDDVNRLGFKVFFCSNSFAAYRKSALVAVGGFPLESIMGEDAIVAAKMLKQGYKKAYMANATVFHSHSYSLVEEFRRYFDTSVFHEQNLWIINDYGKPTGEGIKFVKSEIAYVLKNNPLLILKSVSSIFSKWLGYKAGKYYKNFSVNTLRKLSMHKHYWK